MKGVECEKVSTLGELIKEKEGELRYLLELRRRRMEIQFFKTISGIANTIATKLEKGEKLSSTETLFRARVYEGLSLTELLSLFLNKVFRQRKALVFPRETS